MTENNDTATSSEPAAVTTTTTKKRGGGINGMLLADLKSLAGQLGIKGSGSMKKAALVEAIKAHQATPALKQDAPKQDAPKQEPPKREAPKAEAPRVEPPKQDEPQREEPKREEPAAAEAPAQEPRQRDRQSRRQQERNQNQPQSQPQPPSQPQGNGQPGGQQGNQNKQQDQGKQDRQQGGQNNQNRQPGGQNNQPQGNQGNQGNQDRQQDRQERQDRQQDRQNQAPQNQRDDRGPEDDDEDGDGSRRNRRRRGRDRTRTSTGGTRSEPDTTILEDDVLVPAAGILDVLDNYAFVRTSGYLPGADDVYLSLSMVRKYGLRRGDAVVGQVRQPREGERKEKFNPMVRIDTVNGADPDAAKSREDFHAQKPVHPDQRLRLESGPDDQVGRVIDLVAPIAKGQRGLIVAPAQTGKTTILRAIAASVTRNNPECHLMVVLVDERPEEVTDFQRSVKGEVIASTFDMPPADHAMVAELAVERAKRLVELGHDVVVLLDGLTRLGRAYNLSAPANGRVLAGGVDAAALYPPKRFFGAARNLEDGGSLTILATVAVETGSELDEVLYEELTGTENHEIRLRRDFAEQGLFPAIDPVRSGTRREELVIGEQELAVVGKLSRQLSGLEPSAALENLLGRIAKTQTNIELLTQVQRA